MRAVSSYPPQKSTLPITVHVGYPWPKGAAGEKDGDQVWKFVRDLIETAASTVAKIQANHAAPKLPIRINRLRAMHGGSVLDVLLRRLLQSDVLIFDITGQNPNVVLEIGLALACKGTEGSAFILQKVDAAGRVTKEAAHPSDLSGYFFTRYRRVAKGRGRTFQLIEPQGFAAVLRPRLIKAARERGLWTGARWTVSDETPPARAYRCGSPAMLRADHSRKANKPYNQHEKRRPPNIPKAAH